MATTETLGRRGIGRLGFRKPRIARFATHDVILVDLSTTGAGIRHYSKILPGTKGLLRFKLERERHEIECTLSRSKLELVKSSEKTLQIFRSGLVFNALDGSAGTLKEAIKRRIQRALARQQADAYADPQKLRNWDESSGAIPLDLLASWMETRPYVRCTFDKGKWTQQRVNEPDQPKNGFTVSSEESPAEIQLLCKTYERASEEQRTLIRLFATIAVTEGSDEPRGQFTP